MKLKTLAIAISTALGATLAAGAAHAAGNEVVIGDIDDLSSLYADVVGQGGIEAAKMAIADFGGSVLGKKIVLLTTDHQNKPDIGASKFREWADQNGLTMVLGGSNTGVSIAMAKVAAAILKVADAERPPRQLLLGADAIHYATRHMARFQTEIGEWAAVTLSTAFDE